MHFLQPGTTWRLHTGAIFGLSSSGSVRFEILLGHMSHIRSAVTSLFRTHMDSPPTYHLPKSRYVVTPQHRNIFYCDGVHWQHRLCTIFGPHHTVPCLDYHSHPKVTSSMIFVYFPTDNLTLLRNTKNNLNQCPPYSNRMHQRHLRRAIDRKTCSASHRFALI